MQTLKKLLAVLFISLFVYSCEKIPDITDQEFDFKKNIRTINFELSDDNQDSFKLMNYRPYIRFVKEDGKDELEVRALFMKNKSHYISKVHYTRHSNGCHNDVLVHISKNKESLDSLPVSEAVEISFDMNNLKEMSPFFDFNSKSYFSITIVNEDKNNEKLGYMIVSNDKNGGSVDRPPFVGQFSLE